jgi:hypothetical protein
MFQARQLSADAEEAIRATAVAAAKIVFVKVMGSPPGFMCSMWRLHYQRNDKRHKNPKFLPKLELLMYSDDD